MINCKQSLQIIYLLKNNFLFDQLHTNKLTNKNRKIHIKNMHYHYQNPHKKQMDDILTSPIIPFCLQEIDTNDIMKSIQHTNELIKRTKVYVQNIPIKSNMTSHRESLFQQIYHSQSPQKMRRNESFKSKSQLSRRNEQRVTFDLPLNSFHKSPTPVGKLTDLQEEYETIVTDSPIKMMRSKQQGLFPFQSLEKDDQKDLSYDNKELEIQTFRPTTINMDKKPSQKLIKKPLQINIDKQFQQKSNKNTPKAAKSPLSKTFDLYPTYSSSIPSSTKSGRKINQPKPFQFGQNDKKVSAQEIINYFKKKQQNEEFYKGQNISKEQLFKQKRCERQKVIQQAIKSSMRDSVQKRSVSKGSSSKKATPTKKLFNNTNKPINPFQSIQVEYEQKKVQKTVKSPVRSPIKNNNDVKKHSPTKYTGLIKRKQEIKRQQILHDQGTVKKVTSRPIKINEYQRQIPSPHEKLQINISTSKPEINISHQQNDRKQKSYRRKHGITVLLSTPQKMKVSQIQYRSSIEVSPQKIQNSQRKRSSSAKKHYLQISIKSNNSLEESQRRQQKQQKQSKNFQYKPNLQKKSFTKKQPVSTTTNVNNTVKKHQPNNRQKQSTITQRIYAQLDKIQALNRTGNRINIRPNEQEDMQEQKYDENQQKKLSKKIQRHYQHQKQEQIQVQQQNSTKRKQVLKQQNPKQQQEKLNTTQRFRINQINSITIYPSSLEKYKSSSQYTSHNSSYAELMNNTFAFTPEKRQRLDTDVPLNHIIRLERSMEAFDRSSVEKSLEKSKRKKIFNTDQKSDMNFMKGFKNSQLVKNIFQKEVSNHNKSLQSKLYNFLVEEDAQGKKKQSTRKMNMSPTKMRRSSSKETWRKIFDTDKKSKVHASPRQKSPRSPRKSSFKYKPLNEFQNNLLHRSFESFQDTLRCESIGKNSVQSNKKSTKQNQSGYKTKHKLQEEQIRKQIKKIKQYDFIERYMTNYELQRLMRKYIHENIPTRKWSLMVIDQVYNRIREKKQQQQK